MLGCAGSSTHVRDPAVTGVPRRRPMNIRIRILPHHEDRHGIAGSCWRPCAPFVRRCSSLGWRPLGRLACRAPRRRSGAIRSPPSPVQLQGIRLSTGRRRHHRKRSRGRPAHPSPISETNSPPPSGPGQSCHQLGVACSGVIPTCAGRTRPGSRGRRGSKRSSAR